jgi:hypothetical protein
MATSTRQKSWIAAFVVVAVIAGVAIGLRSSARPPLPPLPPGAPGAPGAPSAAGCASTAACGAGFRCVVPGVCSRACATDADCPSGRRCAELRVVEPDEPGSSAPAVAMTCVVATAN